MQLFTRFCWVWFVYKNAVHEIFIFQQVLEMVKTIFSMINLNLNKNLCTEFWWHYSKRLVTQIHTNKTMLSLSLSKKILLAFLAHAIVIFLISLAARNTETTLYIKAARLAFSHCGFRSRKRVYLLRTVNFRHNLKTHHDQRILFHFNLQN